MSEHPVLSLVRSKVDPSRPFVIVAELQAHNGAAVEAAIVRSQAIPLTRKEPGCLAYVISREGDRFVAFEHWRDLEALKDHLATAHFGAVGAALANLLAAAP